MKHSKLEALSLGILLIAASVSAQRAPSAAYDGDRKVKLAGIVTSVAWVNPSAFFFLNVRDATGTVANWAVEFGNDRPDDPPLGAAQISCSRIQSVAEGRDGCGDPLDVSLLHGLVAVQHLRNRGRRQLRVPRDVVD